MKSTRVCKICGKEYEYCMSLRPSNNLFRWQDVACCKEHGLEYFDRILKSRSHANKEEAYEDMHSDSSTLPKKSTHKKGKKNKVVEEEKDNIQSQEDSLE